MHPIDVPDLVARRASRNGPEGVRWLAELPEIVAELSNRWGLVLGEAYAGGTAAYVVAATDPAGRACVLKLPMRLTMDDHESFARGVLAHQLAAGRGCAEILDHDPSVPALLLERLGPNLAELGMPVTEILETITLTLHAFWRPVAPGTCLRTGRDQAEWLARSIVSTWEELGRPCERRLIEQALDYCERRASAFDPLRTVLVHGDAHGWNTLAAGTGVYKFVDPEGLCSEREHDLGIAMREYNEPLLHGNTARLVRARAQFLADRCAVDPQLVWEWGFIERVSTGLVVLRELDSEGGAAFLEVARRCV